MAKIIKDLVIFRLQFPALINEIGCICISLIRWVYFYVQVYEAVIEDKGKNFIFMRLSKACVEELGLSCDQEFNAQVGIFPLACPYIALILCMLLEKTDCF